MEQQILKEKIKEALEGKKVKAALFYTFNFDPRFFENYVMPLFVPEKTFRDEPIYNKILWRNCIKENLIPPVTVYCDYFAKNNTESPALGYTINCIKTPCIKGKITNFHPKHIFILVEDKGGKSSLYLFTGSGNLTPSGWCENIEGFSVIEIPNKTSSSKSTRLNAIQQVIKQTAELKGNKEYSDSEQLIFDYCKKVDLNFIYFNSLQGSFKDFLVQEVLAKDQILEAEIVSPYFSPNTYLLDFLKDKGIQNIKCLVPRLKDNEIQLEEDLFFVLKDKGLCWSRWANKELIKEVRNNHAKIYRFYGTKKNFTILGSVNFTIPAWGQYQKTNNEANIESAVLYIENVSNSNAQHLLEKDFSDFSNCRFVPKEDQENITICSIDRNPPNIHFTINWQKRLLSYEADKKYPNCSFKSLFEGKTLTKTKAELSLTEGDLKALTKNAIIEIVENRGSEQIIHVYYPSQEMLECKPLDFKLDTATILKYWIYLNDEYQTEGLSRILAEKAMDESGIVKENWQEKLSILNEMAAHFSSLVHLEKFLFKTEGKTDPERQFRNIQYYLVSENIDTIPYFLNELKDKLQEEQVYKSFYWMILQIILQNFYTKAYTIVKKTQFKKEDADLLERLKEKKKALTSEANRAAPGIAGLESAKQQWVIKQLKKTYA